MLPWNQFFSPESGFSNLSINFVRQMRKPIILVHEGVGRITAQYDSIETETFSSAQQRADIMGTSQIMGYKNQLFHTSYVITMVTLTRRLSPPKLMLYTRKI